VNKSTVPFNARIQPDRKQKLKDALNDEGLSYTAWLELQIDAYLKDRALEQARPEPKLYPFFPANQLTPTPRGDAGDAPENF